MGRVAGLCLLATIWSTVAFAQGNGKLQIHYIDVGQGDAAVLISPQGEVVLFDDGVLNQCGKPIGYLQSLGISKIDYHIASHYHSDHIGCAPDILGMFPLQKAAFDRGGTYTTATYTAYVNAVGAKRQTAQKGQTITLDAGSANPVFITFVTLNGNGVPTSDENDLSLVSVVRFGQFDASFGGDLSGAGTGVVDPDPSVCNYTVSPLNPSVPSSGGAFSVSVTTTAGCAWTASTGTSWLSVSSGSSGTGSGTVTLVAAANSGSARSGTATVAGQTVTVSQTGVSTPPPGNTCSRPAGAPASATAVCNDNTYSMSQNRSGTCSSHGGVKCWICPGVLCNGLLAGLYSTPQFIPYTQVPWAGAYADIESTVGALVGKIEVYKVHHHGSKFSSNTSWLAATTPKVGVISMSNANSYGHPTAEALTRLHNAGTKTYWTSAGNGAGPLAGWDVIGGNIVVNVNPGSTTFSVTYGASTDTYADWGFTAPGEGLPSAPPFGSFDTPTSGSIVTGEVGITGWALDNSGVVGVDIYRSPIAGEPVQANGQVFLGSATLVTGARPDIATSYAAYPGASSAGWGYMLLSNMLPNQGNGRFVLSVYVRTTDGANALLATKTVTLANATNTKPFGTIDTPGQGQAVSGTVVNFGWALTPNPNSIPIDGSTIDVYVDGVLRGHPVYNQFRADIATLFPGYANTNGAVGYFVLDTTTLTNGVHTIAWVVRDSAGNASGIGSRYFTVANSPSVVW